MCRPAAAAIACLLLATSASAQEPADTLRPDTASRREAPRRQQVTPELERSAFTDEQARTLLQRARVARLAQDSALGSYDAKSFQRITVGLGVRNFERILLRAEDVAAVRWSRASGLWIEPLGRRAAAPMFGSGAVHMNRAAVTPIPYFPGRETLWTPTSFTEMAKAEVSEDDLLHPLATGAEAYYRYAPGDSVGFTLPGGRRITLRELRITARRPQWRAFVGSFWFEAEQGHLVRAAYRLATEVDLWQEMDEESRREVEKLADDAQRQAESSGMGVRISRAMLNPLRANITAITVEYSLHEGRFWLPRRNVAEGFAQAGFLRMPVTLEERFTYVSVDGELELPRVPDPVDVGLAASDTSADAFLNIRLGGAPAQDTSGAARRVREDSIVARLEHVADSLSHEATSARARGDSTKASELAARAELEVRRARRITSRRAACDRGDSHVSDITTRFDGALRVAVRMPCDTAVLSRSPDLPGSILDPGEEIYGIAEREELLDALGFDLQPQWGPQPPKFHTGLDLLRYNRIEGISLGATATTSLGMGYTVVVEGRMGSADLVPNGELAMLRSAGNRRLHIAAFHRLAVANDDWGAPLSFGASLANALYARDEGFYYRTYGVEVGGHRDAPGPLAGATLRWRLFGERQRSAGVEPNVQASLAHLFGAASFVRNIEATRQLSAGASGELQQSFGADPAGLRFSMRSRAEAAVIRADDASGTRDVAGGHAKAYGRLMLDGTLTRGLGNYSAALTTAVGGAAGALPLQRAFFIGGLHTVRGQFARATGGPGEPRVGDAFWLARAELARGLAGVRVIGFYDTGWAGMRRDVLAPGRPMSGAGAGVSLMDGLFRADISRGIWPEQRWRVDLQLGARF